MLCPHCGIEVGDEARTCSNCGFGLALNLQTLPGTDVAKEIPHQEKQVRRVLLGAIAVMIAAASLAMFIARRGSDSNNQISLASDVGATQPVANVVVTSFVVKPNNYAAYDFAVPPGCTNPYLHGNWQVEAGDSSKGQILILNGQAFSKWKGHLPSTAYFVSRIHRNNLSIRLPAASDRYFIVFDNRSSTLPLKVGNPNVQRACSR